MEFQSERTVINFLTETIVKSGVSLFNAIRYVYCLAEEDFYKCNIKDVLKVVLNNLTDTDCLKNLGLTADSEKCIEMQSNAYNKVLSLIVYSFAVRIPTLKKIKIDNKTMTDGQLRQVYDIVISKGAENYMDCISETFEQNKKIVKQNKELQVYSADWYKEYIFTYVPDLAEIKNKNIYLLGAVDILFTILYTCLEEKLAEIINDAHKL